MVRSSSLMDASAWDISGFVEAKERVRNSAP